MGTAPKRQNIKKSHRAEFPRCCARRMAQLVTNTHVFHSKRYWLPMRMCPTATILGLVVAKNVLDACPGAAAALLPVPVLAGLEPPDLVTAGLGSTSTA